MLSKIDALQKVKVLTFAEQKSITGGSSDTIIVEDLTAM